MIIDPKIDTALQLLVDIGEERMAKRFPHLFKIAMKTKKAAEVEKELAAMENRSSSTREVEVRSYVRVIGKKRGPYKKTLHKRQITQLLKVVKESYPPNNDPKGENA